jgi:hypothetical protein
VGAAAALQRDDRGSSSDAELDDWIKKIGELLERGTAGTKLVSALTAAI